VMLAVKLCACTATLSKRIERRYFIRLLYLIGR
jgi:hypothetical protein